MKNNVIHFTKMHGLGNDFVIINAVKNALNWQALDIIRLSDRHLGIGCDQLIIIEPGQQADFFCRIFNADGSEAEQCGNGLRCVARFIFEEKLHPESAFRLETKAGIFPLHIKDYDHISIMLGVPHINHLMHALELKQTPNRVPVSVLSLGNPHAILKVETVETLTTDQLGHEISTHTFFPQGANVGFMQIINRHHIRLRTFERGVGETHACGSNACAAAVAGIANHWLSEHVQVEFRYGSLFIDWKGENQPVQMTGPASRVFTGEIPAVFVKQKLPE